MEHTVVITKIDFSNLVNGYLEIFEDVSFKEVSVIILQKLYEDKIIAYETLCECIRSIQCNEFHCSKYFEEVMPEILEWLSIYQDNNGRNYYTFL